MSTLSQLRQGLGNTIHHITEGWRHLSDRTVEALTHFTPLSHHHESDKKDALLEQNACRWALLASEVIEKSNEIVIKLEAPGMESDDFDIQVFDNHLVIRGQKRIHHESHEGRYHILERAYGAFERAFPLPSSVNESAATAKYRQGVLRITLPKLTTKRPNRIDIKVE
ncbi:MAG: HSP20 family protein [Halothiobacillaceae bacterium]|nr:MAG: HSP20 family protein [Halothiobacillaceae bacterium]